MRQYKKIIAEVTVSGIILLVLYHCPFLSVYKIPCPGCGMTRALSSFVKGDMGEALYYHPLFWTIPPIVIYLVLKWSDKFKFSRKTENILTYFVVILFIITCLSCSK